MIVFEKDSELAISDMIDKFASGSGMSAACFFFSGLTSSYRTKCRVRMALNVIEEVFSGEDSFAFLVQNLDIIIVFNENDKSLFDDAVYRLYYLFIEDSQIKLLGMEGFFKFYQLPDDIDNFFSLCQSKIDVIKNNSVATVNKINKENRENESSDDSELFDFFDVIYDKLSGIDIKDTIVKTPVFACSKDGSDCVKALVSISVDSKKLLELLGSSFCVYLLKHLRCILSYAILDMFHDELNDSSDKVVMIELLPSVVLSNAFSEFIERISSLGISIIIEMDIASFFMDRKSFLDAADVISDSAYDLCVSNITLSEVSILNSIDVDIAVFKIIWNEDFGDPDLCDYQLIDKRRVIICNCDNRVDFLNICKAGFCLFSGDFISKKLKIETMKV